MKRLLIILALTCTAFGQTAVMGSFTVAKLPAAANAGRLAFVTDGNSVSDCATGTGAIVVLCKDSGAAWAAVATPACATCVTSAASLTSNAVVIGGGSQASSTISADTTTTHALFATAGAPAFRALAAADLPATPATAGGDATLSAPRAYYWCTGTCSITLPTPAAGYEFCVRNDNNISTVITLANITSVLFELPARTGYTAASKGLHAGGAVTDQICVVGRDSTHYSVMNSTGTWVTN